VCKLGRWLGTGLLLAGCIAGALLLWARSGPTLPLPSEDLAARLNREHAGVSEVPATCYARAYEALGEFPNIVHEPLRGKAEPRERLPSAIKQWVKEQASCLELLRQAQEYDRCWFRLDRSADGWLSVEVAILRELCNFLSYRAEAAAESQDLPAFCESIELMDGLARHAFDHPLILYQMMGYGIVESTQDQILKPFAWPGLTSAERAAYRKRISSAFSPPPAECEAMRNEIENTVWQMHQELPWHVRIMCPVGRLYYEYHHALEPFVELASQPVEAQMSGLAELQLELDRRLNFERSKPVERVWRLMAAIKAASWGRRIENRARVVCRQRGNAAVMAIFAHEDAAGSLPTALDGLDGATVIDPLTGEPFIYRLTDDGFILYSVGLDGDDDGGVHHPDWGRQRPTFENPSPEPDGDYVFWPLPE
jgi:hypothetical protein